MSLFIYYKVPRFKKFIVMSRKRSGVGRRKRKTLEAIPFDDWISPGKIAEKTGTSPQVVGIIIGKCLIPVLVEKKDLGVPKTGTFVYRRRPVYTDPKRPRD